MSGDARRLLVATRSEGKLRELTGLFADAGWQLLTLGEAGIAPSSAEDAIEAFETFEENALAKARHFHALSGLPTVADDSGLVVDALGGAPGVRSKRWSAAPGLEGRALDAANNARLLQTLEAAVERTARFVCAAAFVDGTRELVTLGTCEGRIGYTPQGGGGFGYDPLFISDELERTLAEASPTEKSAVSHRGRAFRALLGRLGDPA